MLEPHKILSPTTPSKSAKNQKFASVNVDDNPKFLLGDKLGSGGYGAVIKATRTSDGKQFAIKKCLKKTPTDFSAHRELEVLNLLKFHGQAQGLQVTMLEEFHEDETAAYIVMTLCSGGTLREAFTKAPAFFIGNDKAIKVIAKSLFSTLDRIHTLCGGGIAHLDIKPENILLKYPIDWSTALSNPAECLRALVDCLVLADFGFATQHRMVDLNCGSWGYACPQMLTRGVLVDTFKADVFSTGVLLAELFLGQRLFGRTEDRIRRNTRHVDEMMNTVLNSAPEPRVGAVAPMPVDFTPTPQDDTKVEVVPEDQEKKQQQAVRCDLPIVRGFRKASPLFKDFLGNVLVFDPIDRMAPTEALNHDWLQ